MQPQEITEGDISVLIVEYEDIAASLYKIDLTGLEENFDVGDISSNVRIINKAKVSYVIRWEIELFPLKTGELEIPELNINGKLTRKLTLNVSNASTLESNQKMFLQMTAEPENPYLGQQTNITIKLFHNVSIVNGSLPEPKLQNTGIIRIGKLIEYQKFMGGELYDVLESRYAIFPKTAGEMQIPPVSFNGQVEGQFRELTTKFGSYFEQLKKIKRVSNIVRLIVKGIPSDYSGRYWLPANNLRILDQWNPRVLEFNVGDSLDRTLTLIADGLPAQALPKILFETNDDFNKILYADKPTLTNKQVGKILIGELKRSYALIFRHQGKIKTPKLQFKWWDIDEQIEKETVLPERVLIVKDINPKSQNHSNLKNSQYQTDRQDPSSNYWILLTVVGFLLWACTLLMLIRSRLNSS